MQTGPKLNVPTRMKVLAFLARGDSNERINQALIKEQDLTLSNSALADLRRKHADTIALMQQQIAGAEVEKVVQARNKALNLLNRKLDKAAEDMTAMEKVDQEYRDDKIAMGEWRRRRAGLLRMSIMELTSVIRETYSQIKPGEDPEKKERTGDGAPPSYTAKQLEAVLAALQSGKTVELHRLIMNPGGDADSDGV